METDIAGTSKATHEAAFKASVAIEAIKGQQTVNEIASIYQIHPNHATEWKKPRSIVGASFQRQASFRSGRGRPSKSAVSGNRAIEDRARMAQKIIWTQPLRTGADGSIRIIAKSQ
jgi:transposase-like protein